MTFTMCADRARIVAHEGHLLVTGGPGCGKTTIALRKALERINAGLEPGQKVLFLSFSRAAVARITEAARADMPRAARRLLDIQTFHSFCWQIARGHGYLLGTSNKVQLLAPHDERALRQGVREDAPEWIAERERLFLEEGRIAFDLFAPKVVELLRGSAAIRQLIGSRYPLIIVDEAQDTGTDQWACVQLLSDQSQLVCLADLEQQIYDFRKDVSPDRLKQIMADLKPLEIDLGTQNNRSPKAEIITFGNDVLAGTPRGKPYIGVSQRQFRPTVAERDVAIRSAIGQLYKAIIADTGRPPQSVGYLTNWGKGVAIIARALQGEGVVKSIEHSVAMDEVEVILAMRVLALLLEPSKDTFQTMAIGLGLIAELYKAQGDMKKAVQLAKNADSAREGKIKGGGKCAPALQQVIESIHADPLAGNPGQDWLKVRRKFEESDAAELKKVAQLVVYLMAFNRGRRISDALAEVWLTRGTYFNARQIVESVVSEDQITGGNADLRGINVMTMHKSKGKEFDGIIILHLGNISPYSPDAEAAPYQRSRRLLRVAITRAKHHALLLTDAFSPSPLLRGHKL